MPGTLVLVAPGGDAAHDEQLLAGLHEPEPARLTSQLVARAHGREPVLELVLLLAKPCHLGLTALQHGARVLVGAERLPVEERHDRETGDREHTSPPEHGADFAPRTGAPLRRSGDQAISTLIMFVEPGMLTAVPAVSTTRSP